MGARVKVRVRVRVHLRVKHDVVDSGHVAGFVPLLLGGGADQVRQRPALPLAPVRRLDLLRARRVHLVVVVLVPRIVVARLLAARGFMQRRRDGDALR